LRVGSPKFSPDVAIGRSDGRCVQRVVTKSAWVDDSCLLDIPRSRQIIAIVYPNWWKDFKRFPAPRPKTRRLHFRVRLRRTRASCPARAPNVNFLLFQ